MMRLMISGFGVMLLAFAMLLPGCEPSDASAADVGPLTMNLTLVNASGVAIKDIGVDGADNPIGFSDMPAGGRSTLRLTESQLPKWLEVNWSDSRGKRYADKVKVWSHLGESYRGDLTLTISRRHKVDLSDR